MMICAKPWPSLSIKENVNIFSRLGYEFIRYDPLTYLFKKKRKGTPIEIFKRDLNTIKKAGMGIEEFHHYKIDFRNLKKNLKTYLAAMKLAKVKNFVFHANKNNIKNAKELNKIIKVLKNNNINFCVENECLFVTNPDIMTKVLEKLPDAKICLDIGHSFMSGIDPYEFYKRFKNKIKVIHLHDFTDGKDHQIPFTGKLLRSPIASELRKFKGPLVLELAFPLSEVLEHTYGEAMNMLSKYLIR